jgi:hypothetical protein
MFAIDSGGDHLRPVDTIGNSVMVYKHDLSD